MTQDEAIKTQRIVEEVRGEYPDTKFPNICTTNLWFGKRPETAKIFKDRLALKGWFDEDKDLEWGYADVSQQYKLVRHEEVICKTKQVLDRLPEFKTPKINIKLMDGRSKLGEKGEPVPAARLLMEISFPECQFEVRKGDFLNPEIKAFNSYDLHWEFGYQFWAKQLVCSNGLFAPRCLENVRQKHRLNLDVEEMAEQIGQGMAQFSEQIGLWEKWAQIEMPSSDFGNLFESLELPVTYVDGIKQLTSVFTKKTMEEMMKEEKVNMWDGYSLITQYLTHEVGSEYRKLDIGPAVAKKFQRAADRN